MLKKKNSSLGVPELAAIIGENWRKISDKDKKTWEKKAEKEKEKHEDEMKGYLEEQKEIKTKTQTQAKLRKLK